MQIFKIVIILLLSVYVMAQNDDEKPLYKYSKHKIGAAINIKTLRNDSVYATFVARQFNALTAENCMKMKQIHPNRDTFYWDDTDYLVKYCIKNNLRLHGHALYWHESVPDWVKNIKDSATLEQQLKKHIQTVVTRYKGKVASWDVVNEFIAPVSDSVRQTSIITLLGADFVQRAFIYARAADPDVKLFYNDFLLEAFDGKNAALIRWLDDAKTKNIPIDGVGFQMHIGLDWPDSAGITRRLQEVVKRGYLIHFSELDIENNNETRSVYTDSFAIALSSRYRTIAKIYMTVPEKQRYGITFWNVYDKETWLKRYFKRKYEWPLLFDENYKRKKAFYGFVSGLK